MSPIQFWFSIGSTYSYLTVMRLDAIERRDWDVPLDLVVTEERTIRAS